MFNFSQTPLAVDVLSNHIPTGIQADCKQSTQAPFHCTSTSVAVSWNSVAQNNVPGPITDFVVRDGSIVGSVPESAASCPAGVCNLVDTPPAGAHFYWLYSVGAANIPSPNSAQAEVDE